MKFRYDRGSDRYVGDGTGLGSGWPGFELDEMEVGARAALALEEPGAGMVGDHRDGRC